MKTTLTTTTLTALRTEAWDLLVERYPEDPTLAFIRGIDLQLAAMTPAESNTATSKRAPQKAKRKRDQLGDLIERASIRIFKETIKEPAFGREVVPELRKAGVPLPADDDKAASTIGAVYAKRPAFSKFPGDSTSKKATSRWHLKAA